MTRYVVAPRLATDLKEGDRFRHDGHTHTITRVFGPGDWEVQCYGCTDDGMHSMELFYVPDPKGIVDFIIKEIQ